MQDQLLRLRRLADVPRWAVVPTIRSQSVAEHSFHVASLCMWLAPMHDAVYREVVSLGDVLAAALVHDEAEAITGDIPAPAKQFMDGAGTEIMESELGINGYPNKAIKQIVKMADITEAMLFLWEDMRLGNMAVKRVLESLAPHLAKEWYDFEYKRTKGDRKMGSLELFNEAKSIYAPHRHPALDHIG